MSASSSLPNPPATSIAGRRARWRSRCRPAWPRWRWRWMPTMTTLDAILPRRCRSTCCNCTGGRRPTRVAEIRARYGLPVMKAVGVAGPRRPAQSSTPTWPWPTRSWSMPSRRRAPICPAAMGCAFDWRLIAGRHWPMPWMLAGGLTPDNVAEAIRLTGARQVDVSSGVESAPGVKDARPDPRLRRGGADRRDVPGGGACGCARHRRLAARGRPWPHAGTGRYGGLSGGVRAMAPERAQPDHRRRGRAAGSSPPTRSP